MVLKTVTRSLILFLLVLASRGVAAETPRPGEVTLPLKDYLAMEEKGEALEKERVWQAALRQAPIAEVVSQRVRVVIDDQTDRETAEATADFEVLVQGQPKGPVVLPVSGVPRKAEVRRVGAPATGTPAAALSAGAKPGEWLLVAPAPGRYAVRISGPVPLPAGGVGRLTLAPAAAAVSLTEVELPADLAWSAPGVVVEDRVEGRRRTVRLTTRRGEAQVVEVRRKVDGGEADRLLVQSTVLTLVQLRPEGPRRHDVVIYEVSRGGLGSFTVDLPPGLAVEAVGTDEGDVTPAVESRRLTVNRRQQLRGVGYLVLTSTPTLTSSTAELPVDPVMPGEAGVRARYVALSSSIAADVHPLPQESWSRVDLDDLPPSLRDALGGVDLAAAWRLTGPPSGLRMAVSPLPAAASLPAVASLRETTTLLTLDGTLLHRDRITLRPGAIGTALDLTLPVAATLWSAKVDDLPVRPLMRGGGRISVPLGFDAGRDSVVEIVAVLEKALPAGRSDLAFDLPRIAVPVQEHRWRLLLPDGARYRFRSGDLRPAVAAVAGEGRGRRISTGATVSAAELEKIPTARNAWSVLQTTPGVLTDRINTGGNESGQQSTYVAESPSNKPKLPPPAYYDFDAFEEEAKSLKQGLVGGIKPLPIAIPETGKLLLLTGVLPPERVGVELEVKGKR
jgi:hypothetical protein